MSRSVAQHIIDDLEARGISRVHALPGEENLAIVDALRTSNIDVVVHRHEQNAAFTAAAEGRLSGLPGVCLATLGPGATNLFTALAHARLGGFPMIAITGQKPALDNREGSFQVIDVVAAATPLVKRAVRLDDPLDVVAVVESAWRAATRGRPGPVLIELPEDVASRTTDATARAGRSGAETSVPIEAMIDAAVELIDDAERPVVLLSEHANRSENSDAILAFTEATGIGVLTTQLGAGGLDGRHPHALGTLGIHRPDHAHLGLLGADLVVAVGYDPVEHPPLAWNRDDDLAIIHVAPWPANTERGYRPVMDLVGGVAITLERLAARVRPRSTEDLEVRRDIIRSLLSAEHASSAEGRERDESVAPTPLDVVDVLRRGLADEDCVVLDNGVYKIWFARHWEATGPQTLLMDNALASMGAGLGTGLAAALHDRKRRTVVVAGDGGFLMNVQDLATADQLDLDITMVVLRDDMYGFIAWHQDEQELPRSSVSLDNPDLVQLAHAFGASAVRVRDRAELALRIERSRHQRGVHVIECPIDYSINTLLDGSADQAIDRYRNG